MEGLDDWTYLAATDMWISFGQLVALDGAYVRQLAHLELRRQGHDSYLGFSRSDLQRAALEILKSIPTTSAARPVTA